MPQLDGKYSIVDNRVVKTATGEPIPEDEPVILFRARDTFAVTTLHYYLEKCIKYECTDYQINGMREIIGKFEEFRQTHPDKIKVPGVTKGL